MSEMTRRAAIGLGIGALAAGTRRAFAAPSLEAMIGQMLMIGFAASDPAQDSAQRLARDVAEGRAGGVVFLGHNVRTREGATGLASLFGSAGAATVPFVALDHEGGRVQRLSAKLGFTAIPQAREIAAGMSAEDAGEIFSVAAREMRGAGFNLNLAPVVDLADPANPVIGTHGRSFGRDPKVVAAYCESFVEAFDAAGIGTVLKHFPGHGLSRGDSHDGFVDISRTFDEDELEPFRLMIASGHARAIMPGHLFLPEMADGEEPVSLSRRALTGILRQKLGFDGVIVTDDLDMGAVRSRYSQGDAVLAAVGAGSDVVMLSNSASPDPDLARRMIDLIGGAVAGGRLPGAQIEASYARIQRLKALLG